MNHIRARLSRVPLAGWLALAASLLGLALRLEHAFTFDGHLRGSDYEAHMGGVRWMMHHWRPFYFVPDVGGSIGYQPPLWYAVGALLLRWTHVERTIAFVAVAGWVVRQIVLARMMREAAPNCRWSALVALSINAVLPISVLTDGKVNPEGLHSTLFTVALYFLWRMERQARQPAGISVRTAVAFGAVSGLALLTKATASVLPLGAVVVLLWHAFPMARRSDWRAAWIRILRPAIFAGAVWCMVVGWWCGPNLVKYGHPFPHSWDLETPGQATPVLYRRPLGWILPFYWTEYLKAPIIESPEKPRPNLWAVLVSGTWSDFYNRGFCRLSGGGVIKRFWDGQPVSGKCLRLFGALVWIGCFITLAAVLAMIRTALSYLRSRGAEGSMALPLMITLCVFFSSLFALVYPYDGSAVLNPRYLLPESTALSACLGIALAELKVDRVQRRWVHGLLLAAIAAISLLMVIQRWGGRG